MSNIQTVCLQSLTIFTTRHPDQTVCRDVVWWNPCNLHQRVVPGHSSYNCWLHEPWMRATDLKTSQRERINLVSSSLLPPIATVPDVFESSPFSRSRWREETTYRFLLGKFLYKDIELLQRGRVFSRYFCLTDPAIVFRLLRLLSIELAQDFLHHRNQFLLGCLLKD